MTDVDGCVRRTVGVGAVSHVRGLGGVLGLRDTDYRAMDRPPGLEGTGFARFGRS